MSHNKKAKRKKRTEKKEHRKNEKIFYELILELIPDDQLFTQDRFHGNVKWTADDLVRQALIWSWQETKKVTDAFEQALEICEALGFQKIAHTYTAFMNALDRYRETFNRRLWRQFHLLAESMAGRFWRDEGWLLMGFDGSRASTPRTVANEKEFCAPNYGQGATAKYRKKKTKGMRRKKNEKNKPQPQGPQVWITMMWHMSLRLPWSWRLGPSNSSERGHVVEMLEQEEFPKNTLFCGDAGFVGYPLWQYACHRIMPS